MSKIDDRNIALNTIMREITKKKQSGGSINPDSQNLPGGILPDVQNFKFVPRGVQTKPDTPPRVLQPQAPANNPQMPPQQPGAPMPQQAPMPPQPPQQQSAQPPPPPSQQPMGAPMPQPPMRTATDLLFATGVMDKLISRVDNPDTLCLIIKEACRNNKFIKAGFVKLAAINANPIIRQIIARALNA